VIRWLLTVIVISLLFSVFYCFGPKRTRPSDSGSARVRVIGTVIFLAASVGFSFYVAKFGHPQAQGERQEGAGRRMTHVGTGQPGPTRCACQPV
jgi:hypothetical protein